jgi:hypothetical protein
MEFERYVIGYDVRPRRNPARSELLPSPASEDDDLYSVDDSIWPSVWASELRDAPRSAFMGTVQHLWMDLDQLREETTTHVLSTPVRWIGIEVVMPASDEMRDTWRGRADPVRPATPRREWTNLGCDVADYYLRSWLRAAKETEFRRQVDAPLTYAQSVRPVCSRPTVGSVRTRRAAEQRRHRGQRLVWLHHLGSWRLTRSPPPLSLSSISASMDNREH